MTSCIVIGELEGCGVLAITTLSGGIDGMHVFVQPTFHEQLRGTLGYAAFVDSSAREDAAILWVGFLYEQSVFVVLLEHLKKKRSEHVLSRHTANIT
jgi:hypothetical protein